MIRFFRLVSIALIGCIVVPSAVFAQSGSQFEVGIEIVNNDTTAPSIPTGLSASALTTSSISVSWNPSTDNVGVVGYVVYRDSVAIATTSSTSYIDTGLTADTTYVYEVQAFDAIPNYSGLSAPASGTTLSDTPTPTVPGNTGSVGNASVPPRIVWLEVETDETSALISFESDQITRATVRYGLEEEYGMGIVREGSFSIAHQTRLTGLIPGTRYYFSIEIENRAGDTYRLSGQSFVTELEVDVMPPVAPSHFIANGQKDAIYLLWQNPANPDFASVVLVRSTLFYPVDPLDGELVYQGDNESFVDRTVRPGVVYYYTLFARDRNGNYSNGVIAAAVVPYSLDEGPDAPYRETPTIPGDPFVHLPDAASVPASIERLTFLDFDFIQNEITLPQIGRAVSVRADRPLTIRTGYERLPEVLKTIAVTLTDPLNPALTFTFLLRITDDKESYEAMIASLNQPGRYPMAITILDYKNQKLKRIEGTLVVAAPSGFDIASEKVTQFFSTTERFVLIALILAIPLLWWLIIWRRRRRNEEENKKSQSQKHF